MTAARGPFGNDTRRRNLLRRFARDTGSVALLEFALLGTAFFFFVLGMFMIGVTQYWQMTLDDSVRNAARQIAIDNVTTPAAFTSTVCGEFGLVIANCSANLTFDVQNAATFGAMTPATLSNAGLSTPAGFPATITTTSFATAKAGSTAATPGSIEYLLVQVAYQLPFTIPWLGGAFTENGTNWLYSVVAVVME